MKKTVLALLLLMPVALFAQSAEDYFHRAANYYVNAQKEPAKKMLLEGIQKYPNDTKLRNLAAKVEELPDPENQDQNQNQNGQDNQEQNQEEQQQNQEQQQQDQQNQEQQQQQGQEQQISPEDAQRILEALAQEEKDLQEKLQKKERAGHRPKIEKNW